MTEFSLIELESLWIRSSFARLPVDYKHPRYLRKLCKYDLVLVFNAADDSIRE